MKKNYLKQFNDIHNLNTRNKYNFIIPKFKIVIEAKTIRQMGAVIWNSPEPDHDIILLRNINSFRKNI